MLHNMPSDPPTPDYELQIERELAIAIVRGGLSLDTFSRLTLAEWQAVAAEIAHRDTDTLRSQWEQTRQIIYATLAPHLRDHIAPHQLMPLPWDVHTSHTQPVTSSSSLPTQEEIRQMIQRFGGASSQEQDK